MKYISYIIIVIFSIGAVTLFNSNLEIATISELNEPSPFGREEWRAMMRNHDASPSKRKEAEIILTKRLKKQKNYKDAGIGDWEELARGDEGGRIRTIATHPTDPAILYVGGASGGVWKSTDGGASWSPKSDRLASLSISKILVHPTNPDTLYASTGEAIGSVAAGSPGAGIFRSLNGGNTWHLLPALESEDINSFTWVSQMAFDRLDPSKFYFTVKGQGSFPTFGSTKIYLSEDNGASIGLMHTFTSSVGTVGNILVNPSDNNHILVAHTEGLAISWDKGITWSELTSGNSSGWLSSTNRVEIAMSASSANIVYAVFPGNGGDNGTLLFSSNKGVSWSIQQDNLNFFNVLGDDTRNQGDYDNVIWVSPLDVNELIIGGPELYRSSNAGFSFDTISQWTLNDIGQSPHADHHVIIEATDFSATNRKVYFGNDGGIAAANDYKVVTTNSGWDLLNNNSLGITQYYASDIWDGNIIAGSQDNGILSSTDDGVTMEVEGTGDGGYCGISHQNKFLAYASTQLGVFYVSNPQYPATIRLKTTPFLRLDSLEKPLIPPFFCPLKVYPNDGTKVLIGGNKLWNVKTEAVTHDTISTEDVSPPGLLGTITAIDISTLSSGNQRIVIGTSGGEIWETKNDTWNNWNQLFDINTTVTSIDIANYNQDKIIISAGGYIDNNIHISTDGGSTWTEKSNGIPALQVSKVLWHPNFSNFIYAGTDLGVFSTDDGGNNWNVTPHIKSTSDGPVFTEVTDLHFSKAIGTGFRYLYATTYGRGIWKTEDRIRNGVYFDEDATVTNDQGTQTNPFLLFGSGEDVQAHGQTWHVDGGTYTVPTKVVIDKRIGKVKKTGTGSIIIGEN